MSGGKPLVTIVMAVRDGEAYIARRSRACGRNASVPNAGDRARQRQRIRQPGLHAAVAPADAIGRQPAERCADSREAVARVGPFPVDPRAPEWLQWYARAVGLGVRAAAVPETVLRCRLHGSNHSAVNQTAQTRFLDIVRESLRERRAAARTEPGGADR
jgi:hypothetical protein